MLTPSTVPREVMLDLNGASNSPFEALQLGVASVRWYLAASAIVDYFKAQSRSQSLPRYNHKPIGCLCTRTSLRTRLHEYPSDCAAVSLAGMFFLLVFVGKPSHRESPTSMVRLAYNKPL